MFHKTKLIGFQSWMDVQGNCPRSMNRQIVTQVPSEELIQVETPLKSWLNHHLSTLNNLERKI